MVDWAEVTPNAFGFLLVIFLMGTITFAFLVEVPSIILAINSLKYNNRKKLRRIRYVMVVNFVFGYEVPKTCVRRVEKEGVVLSNEQSDT